MGQNNTFAGDDALFAYLNPHNGHFSPLVELPTTLNPFRAYNVRLHAKVLSALPLGNIKSITAFSLLEDARNTGKTRIIESSSGNTAASLGVLAPHFGYQDVHAYVSHEVTPGKLKMLQLFNVTPLVNQEPICPSENDQDSGIKKARQKGQEGDWYNPDQYANAANIRAHYTVTGPEIWQQTKGAIDYFCAGMGTTGTLIGTAHYLREQKPDIQTIGVVRLPNNPVPGPRTKNLLQDISFDWKTSCDHLMEIGTVQSYALSLEMIRQGLIVGPSSGMNLAGAYQFTQRQIDKGEFYQGQPEVNIVFTCCDTPYPYLDEYFSILPEQAFPAVHNKHLLQFSETKSSALLHDVPQATVHDVLSRIQQKDARATVIDVRSAEKFCHYHIPNAVNIPRDDFITHLDDIADLYRDQDVYLVCDFGKTSAALCRMALGRDIKAFSMSGGMTEWSAHDLPRVKDPACVVKYGLSA